MRGKKSTNLVESWCQDRYKKTIVDVANKLVSDIRVGHLSAANNKAHVSQGSSQAEGHGYLPRVNAFFMWRSRVLTALSHIFFLPE